MLRIERQRNTDFETYMEEIVNHPNYRGLPIERKRDGTLAWFAFANGTVGQARKRWAEDKARELGFSVKPGVYAEVMREIHPTKMHVCQICGSVMSIYYYYPSVNFIKSLKAAFGLEFTECDHISSVWDKIHKHGVSKNDLRLFLKHKFELPENILLDSNGIEEQVRKKVRKQSKHWEKDENGLYFVDVDDLNKYGIITLCERMCRVFGKKLLSPGAMSNFPDRFDGFHTYNRCCRAEQDTGRSKKNMTRYNKDRRAYEYWSDGNLRAADQFMNSVFFEDTSADHIGPISLGFVHDSHYIQPMLGGDNSAKRDRLLADDVKEIISIEKRTGICAISWYSAKIWNFTKNTFNNGLCEQIPTICRNILKQNMVNFMFILKTILDETDIRGQQFLIEEFIEPKYNAYFFQNYTFDKHGNIFSESIRNFTARSDEELNRFIKISFDSVYEYAEKENRNLSPYLTADEQEGLKHLCLLLAYADFSDCRKLLEQLIDSIQIRLIQTEITEQAR